MKWLSENKMIITLGVIAALIIGRAVWDIQPPKVSKKDPMSQAATMSPLVRVSLSPAGLQAAAQNIALLPAARAIVEMRRAFLELSLERPDGSSRLALAQLRGGLDSENTEVRKEATRFVEYVLIGAAHSAAVDPVYTEDLRALVENYRLRGQERIRKLRTAFPHSPVLAYLKNFERK